MKKFKLNDLDDELPDPRGEPSADEKDEVLQRLAPLYHDLLRQTLQLYTVIDMPLDTTREALASEYVDLLNHDFDMSELLPGDRLFPARKAAERIESAVNEVAYLEKQNGTRFSDEDTALLVFEEVARAAGEEYGEGSSRPLTREDARRLNERIGEIGQLLGTYFRRELVRRAASVAADPRALVDKAITDLATEEILHESKMRDEVVQVMLGEAVAAAIERHRGVSSAYRQ